MATRWSSLQALQPKGVVHCFSGSKEMAKEIIKLGMYIGLNGVATFKNARKALEVVETIPLERLVLETDCPYLAPEPCRGQRNNSALIPHIAARIGQVLGLSPQAVLCAKRRRTPAHCTVCKSKQRESHKNRYRSLWLSLCVGSPVYRLLIKSRTFF